MSLNINRIGSQGELRRVVPRLLQALGHWSFAHGYLELSKCAE